MKVNLVCTFNKNVITFVNEVHVKPTLCTTFLLWTSSTRGTRLKGPHLKWHKCLSKYQLYVGKWERMPCHLGGGMFHLTKVANIAITLMPQSTIPYADCEYICIFLPYDFTYRIASFSLKLVTRCPDKHGQWRFCTWCWDTILTDMHTMLKEERFCK